MVQGKFPPQTTAKASGPGAGAPPVYNPFASVQRMAAPPVYQPNAAAPVQRMAAPQVNKRNAPIQRVAAPHAYRPKQATQVQRMVVPIVSRPAVAVQHKAVPLTYLSKPARDSRIPEFQINNRVGGGVRNTLQRSPRKKSVTEDEYFDSVYPSLKIIAVDLKNSPQKYKLAGEDRYVYYEEDSYFINEQYDPFDMTPYHTKPTGDYYNYFPSEKVTLVNIELIHSGRDDESLDMKRLERLLGGMKTGAYLEPIDVNSDYEIQNGNHRLAASIKMGFKKIPIKIS